MMRCAGLAVSLWMSAALAQTTVLVDDFESGAIGLDWLTADATRVLFGLGEGADGSDYYARVQGVTGVGAQAGLGVSLANLDGANTGASDFSIDVAFRVDPTIANRRMFNLMVNSSSNAPTPSDSAVNLRYWNNQWQAYNGSWQSVGLPSIQPGEWNQLTLTGSSWGSGVPGAATWGAELNGGGAIDGLQLFQSDTDFSGARSLSLNDRWDGVGFDVDDVLVSATPGPPVDNTVTVTPVDPFAYSGIYPHTAASNTHNESAVGTLLKRDGKVWFVTYGPHVTAGGSDELYSVDLQTLQQVTYRDYPGNTNANRYSDTRLGIDIVGSAFFDPQGELRYLPATNPGAGDLVGRITGTAAHLTDPNKIYFATMEEGLYEVDFSDAARPVISTLRADGNHDNQGGIQKNLPGVHGKGLYTGQGRLFFTNNGQGSGALGGLVEWDGVGDPEQLSSWTIADDRAQYTEVTSRRGPVDMEPTSHDAIWATGWDDESMFINTRDAASGEWTKFRLPRGSYTHGHPNGWYTEWPRIRDIGLEGGYLMSHHGMMFLVPETFSADNPGGVAPVATHHKMIVDYVEDGDRIVFAGNDSSRQLGNTLLPRANSNIFFLDKVDLPAYGGTPRGYGGVWVEDDVAAGEASDAFLIDGFRDRVLHLAHEGASPVDFRIEVNEDGVGQWRVLEVVSVPAASGGNAYAYAGVPIGVSEQWLRVTPIQNATSATAYLHLGNRHRARNDAMAASVARPGDEAPRSVGLLRSRGEADYKLEFAANRLDARGDVIDSGFYRAQLNPQTQALEIVAVTDAAAEASVRSGAATTQDYGVDAASAFIDYNGLRYRLPKGDAAFDGPTAVGWRRGEREVVTERDLLNVHGTFYEVPHEFGEGGFRRLLPITTHNRDIHDFMSWRGMLVLSGVTEGGAADGHYVESDDGRVGLWFGNVDDLYRFGTPVGEGGPWKESAVEAGVASDAYLMAGYDHKTLDLSHDSGAAVEFTIEVDFLGADRWSEYATIVVPAGEEVRHVFPSGYSAHWVRVTPSASTVATAWFEYTVAEALAGDYDHNGVVDRRDYLVWLADFGSTERLDADGNGDGRVDAADYTIWRDNSPAPAQATPEPSSIAAFGAGIVAHLIGGVRSQPVAEPSVVTPTSSLHGRDAR